MTDRNVGAIGSQAAVRRWQLDDVTLTYVVDGAMSMAPDRFFPAIPTEYWDTHADNLDTHGRVPMSAGGLLVERSGHTMLIDAGLGCAQTDLPLGRIDSGAFLETLARLRVDPTAIDVLALTHLHVDHIGWLYSEAGCGTVTATFPNASYLLAELEWAPYASGAEPSDTPDRQVVIDSLRNVRRPTLINDGDAIASKVVALVTPGHTLGHTSYVITTAAGRRLIAFGDAFHVPAQLSNPQWRSVTDAVPNAVLGARRRIIEELAEPETYGFAFHFGDQPFGWVSRDSTGVLEWKPVPTAVLGPPPYGN